MAARRDELDAYVFARKRVVAAFLLGGDASNDEGAPRPVRAFMASLIVAGLLLAGYGVIGLLKKDTPPEGWKHALILDKDTASRYLYTEDTKQLHSVLNMVSARLALPANDYHVVVVPHRLVMSTPHGVPIGIAGAPDNVPAPGAANMVRDWTICAEPGPPAAQTLLVGVAPAAADRLGDGGAALVRTETGQRWVVAAGRRFLVRDDTALKGFLGTALSARDAEPVSSGWLNLLPAGSPIDFQFEPTGLNRLASVNLPASLSHVGTVVRTTAGDRQRYVVTAQGLAPISELAADVLMDDPANEQNPNGEKPISLPASSQAASVSTPFGPQDWPAAPVTVRNIGANQTLCAQDPTPLAAAGAAAAAPVISAGAGLPDPSAARSRIRVGGGQATDEYVYVKPGEGAMVQAVTGTARGSGPVYLISDIGTRFQLVPPDPDPTAQASAPTLQDTLGQLGFKDSPLASVSASWLAFLPMGGQLNHNRAVAFGAGT